MSLSLVKTPAPIVFCAAETCFSRTIYCKQMCSSCYRKDRYRRRHQPRTEQSRQAARLETRRAYIRTDKGRYIRAKARAKRRGVFFNLSESQYSALIVPECFYCEGFFGRVETGVGLDRLDNEMGYQLGNVVSCCTWCNRFRNSMVSSEEAYAAIQAVIQIRRKNEHERKAG
jgi:hypothetical protein